MLRLIRIAVTPAFGLWRVRFPPCLVRPGRRLPVQGLSSLTRVRASRVVGKAITPQFSISPSKNYV